MASFLITFRESLEAALIVGIILSYLKRTKQEKFNNVVYLGVVAGIVASILGAVMFDRFAGGFEGRAEEIFEGITMLVGAALLTTMIFWMMRQKSVAKDLEAKVATKMGDTHKLGLFSLVFVSVLREGVETVIFLEAARFVSGENTLAWGLAGVVGAVILGYGIFVGSMKIKLSRFFNATSILLILFAAGLIAHGIHELQEAGIIPTLIEHVWDTNSVLDEKGVVGSFLKGLFGYNGNPSLIEVGSYFLYLAVFLFGFNRVKK